MFAFCLKDRNKCGFIRLYVMYIVTINEYTILRFKIKSILVDCNGCLSFIYVYKLMIAMIMRYIVKIFIFYTTYVCSSIHVAAFIYRSDVLYPPFFIYFITNINKCLYSGNYFLG